MKKTMILLGCLVVILGAAACGGYLTTGQEDNIYLVLVNKEHQLPEDWLEKIQLEETNNCYGEIFQVEQEALNAFILLHAALLKEGVDIELDSTYRSPEEQQAIWDEWSKDPELGEEYCRQYLAVPGYSEHHTGLAVDVFLYKDGEAIRDNDDMIAEKEDFAKVHAKLADYGFILRYPEGKEDITGYAYEPWHFRYVRTPQIAKDIMENNLTLEEYLSSP